MHPFVSRGLPLASLLVAGISLGSCPSAQAAPSEAEVRAVIQQGADYLKTAQNPDGSFAPRFAGPGITALVAVALLEGGYGPDDPVVAKAMNYLEKNVQPDGGIYQQRLANYTTSLAIVAFKEANTDRRYDKIIENAVKFLKNLQTSDLDRDDPRFGGAGYSGHERPDLSNTQMFLDAMVAAGVDKTDPSLQRAVVFLSRCQNLKSEYNQLPYAAKATEDDRGGFTYNPLEADDEKSRRRTPQGGLRSEGAMTYAGLKSFLYAGVSKDDPRVKAAIDWIRRHYTLQENPGAGQAGLYYYYHTFAKAMDALGEDTFVEADGTKHDWRQELFETLKAKQKEDGSWANPNRAFLENQPELATAFAILALSYCNKE